MDKKIKVLRKENGKPSWLLTKSPQIEQFDVLIGWDSEFRNKEGELNSEVEKIISEEEDLKTVKKKVAEIDQKRTKNSLFNDVVSYQLSLYSQQKNCYVEAIIYLVDQKEQFAKRISLARILAISLELLDYQGKEITQQKVLLVAQYSIAEFSTLAISDRKSLSKKLISIQGTLASTSFFDGPVLKYQTMTETQKGNLTAKKVRVLWRDTKILAPPNANSLKDIASQTLNKKIEISVEQITNIVKLLNNNQTLYEQYAINDAIVTLEFFCKFMDRYYYVTSKQRVVKIPLTAVGSSEFNYLKFLEFCSEKNGFEKNYLRKITFGLENNKKMLSVRENDESMVNRAYLGGKNNIARYYNNYQLKPERKIAIDIDITSAYPRAFGCIPLPDWQSRGKRSIAAKKFLKASAHELLIRLKLVI